MTEGGTEHREPPASTAAPARLFSDYLRYYRETAIAKVGALDPERQRQSQVPSGWSPLELLYHLAAMETRWFVWGFLGEQVGDPFPEERDGGWGVPGTTTLADIEVQLRRVGERTTALLETTPLEAVAVAGPRFDGEPPSLGWICFHVLQEYARHAGHLDIAVELAGGPTGE